MRLDGKRAVQSNTVGTFETSALSVPARFNLLSESTLQQRLSHKSKLHVTKLMGKSCFVFNPNEGCPSKEAKNRPSSSFGTSKNEVLPVWD